jgi:hypothetical protein
MGRALMPDYLKRSKMLPLRLTQDEWKFILKASRDLGISVSDIFRQGARLFIERGKDGSPKQKEKRR